jgi:hypothetical protein
MKDICSATLDGCAVIPTRVKKWGPRIGIPLAVLLGGGAVAYAAGLVTWTDGQTLKAADLNGNFTNLQAQITALQAEVHPASAFHASLSTATPIPNATGTLVVFNSVEYDLAQEYSETTGAFTPKNAGKYLLHCQVEFSTPLTSDWAVSFQKNGVEMVSSDLTVAAASTAQSNGAMSPTVVGMYQLAAGDSVQCYAYQNTGAAQGLYTTAPARNNFSAARLY